MLLPSLQVLALLSGLTVETGSPDALCPDVASAEAAIRARVGELESNAASWRVRYTMVHAPDRTSGDFVRLQIYDSEGVLQLSRDLPLAAEACATMAQAMALVVERFFRAMVGERPPKPEVEVEMSTTTSAAPLSATPPVERDRGAQQREPWTSARKKAFILGARGGLVGPSFRPSAGPFFVFQAAGPLSLATSLDFVLVPWTTELDRGGQAHLQAGFLRVLPAWDLAFAGARLALGPTLGVSVERAWSTGLATSADQYRTTAAAGGAMSLRIAAGDASVLDLSLLVEAPFRPFGGEFMIDDGEVLEPPPVRTAMFVGWAAAWGR